MTAPPPGPIDPPGADAPPPAAPPPPGATPAPPGPWASDAAARAGSAYAPPERPKQITTAMQLMLVGAVLTALGILASLLQIDSIRDAIRDADTSLTESELDAAVATAVAFSVVIGIVGVGLWLWMRHTNGQGKSWARVVATILGLLNIVFTLMGIAGDGSTPVTVAISLISVVLAAVILYFLWQPESSRYYEAMSRR